MINSLRIFLLICLLAGAAACEKDPGPGGKASITGKVYVKDYNTSVTTLLSEYYGAGEKVYICYGDDQTSANDVSTGTDGSFAFRYLRKGHYTVFIMTRDTGIKYSGADAEIPLSFSVDISDKKETKDLGTITICK
jgi:hypothetical protein